MITYVTTFPAHLAIPVVEECIRNLSSMSFSDVTIPERDVKFELLKEARTYYMSCTIFDLKNYPRMYQLRFSSLYLTGKADEVSLCISKASKSENKISVVWEKVDNNKN